MLCGAADCTGVHMTSRPMATWCPRTRARHNERKREYYARNPYPSWIRVNNSRNRADQRRLDGNAEAQARLRTR